MSQVAAQTLKFTVTVSSKKPVWAFGFYADLVELLPPSEPPRLNYL